MLDISGDLFTGRVIRHWDGPPRGMVGTVPGGV